MQLHGTDVRLLLLRYLDRFALIVTLMMASCLPNIAFRWFSRATSFSFNFSWSTICGQPDSSTSIVRGTRSRPDNITEYIF